MPNNETINLVLLMWTIATVAFLLLAAFSPSLLRNVANYCVSRAAGRDSYHKTFSKKRVRRAHRPSSGREEATA